MEAFSYIDYCKAALISSAWFLFAAFFAYKRGFFRFLSPLKSCRKQISAFLVLGVFGLFLGIAMTLPPLIFSLGEGGGLRTISTIITIATCLLAVLLVSFFCSFATKKALFGENFFKVKHMLSDLLLGMSSWLLCYPLIACFISLLTMLLFFLAGEAPVEQVAIKQLKQLTETPLLFGVMFVAVNGAVPLMEEVLFRAYLQSWFCQYMPAAGSIVFTSIIFSLFHFSEKQGISNITILAALFVLSCFLGYLKIRQQSLWAPIALHATFNTISSTLIYLQFGV